LWPRSSVSSAGRDAARGLERRQTRALKGAHVAFGQVGASAAPAPWLLAPIYAPKGAWPRRPQPLHRSTPGRTAAAVSTASTRPRIGGLVFFVAAAGLLNSNTNIFDHHGIQYSPPPCVVLVARWRCRFPPLTMPSHSKRPTGRLPFPVSPFRFAGHAVYPLDRTPHPNPAM